MFPQLVRRIVEHQTLTPFFAHVVGKRPDEQIVIEGPAGGFRRRRAKPAKPLIQTNHFVHAAHRHHNGEEWQGHDCDICDRYGPFSSGCGPSQRTSRTRAAGYEAAR